MLPQGILAVVLMVLMSAAIAADSEPRASAAPPARSIGELLALTAAEIAATPEVHVVGTVTVANPLLVQDATGALFVNDVTLRVDGTSAHTLGTTIAVSGRLNPGGFVPMIAADSIEVLARGDLPEAESIDLGNLFGGAATGRRIAIDGVVQGARSDAATWVLVVESAARRLFIDLPKSIFPDDPGHLVDARIHCAGSVLAVRNTRGDFLGPVIRVVRPEDMIGPKG